MLSQFNSFANPPIDNLENLDNSKMKLKLNIIKKRKEKIESTKNVLTQLKADHFVGNQKIDFYNPQSAISKNIPVKATRQPNHNSGNLDIKKQESEVSRSSQLTDYNNNSNYVNID